MASGAEPSRPDLDERREYQARTSEQTSPLSEEQNRTEQNRRAFVDQLSQETDEATRMERDAQNQTADLPFHLQI